MLRIIDRLAISWMNWRRRREINRNPELKDFKVEQITANEHGIDIAASVPKGSVAWIANELARLLVVHNAKNYVQMDMMPSMDVADKPVRITVAWAYGESPAANATRLENELERLNSKKDVSLG